MDGGFGDSYVDGGVGDSYTFKTACNYGVTQSLLWILTRAVFIFLTHSGHIPDAIASHFVCLQSFLLGLQSVRPQGQSTCSQASAIACITARDFATASSYSYSGFASATVPPPACTWATPSLTTTVRMWIAVSRSPA
jgi:hypothetical protein